MTTESKPRPLKDQTTAELRERIRVIKARNSALDKRLDEVKAAILNVPGCYHTVNGEECGGTVTFEAGSEVGVCQRCGGHVSMFYEG